MIGIYKITSPNNRVYIGQNVIYNGVKECCEKNNLNIKTMYSKLSGLKTNNTSFKYYNT